MKIKIQDALWHCNHFWTRSERRNRNDMKMIIIFRFMIIILIIMKSDALWHGKVSGDVPSEE